MDVIQRLENFLSALATKIPVEVFTLFGAFVEEVIAPIPSPLVMATAGSIAFAQAKGYLFLFWLSFIGAIGKVAGAWVIYYIVVKFEDAVVKKFGRFFGVSTSDVQNLEKIFKGKTRRNLVVLSLLRAAPVVPSSPVSVVCGLVKLDPKTYLLATFLGTLVRNLVFLFIGYAGVAAYSNVLQGFDNLESILQVLMLLLIVGAVLWFYTKRRGGHLWEWVRRKFS